MAEEKPAKTATSGDSEKKAPRAPYRPAERLPETLLAEIGEPPDDDIKRRAWYAKVLAAQTWGILRGKNWKAMNESTRANAVADAKLTTELVAEKVRKLLVEREREADDENASRAEMQKDQDGAPRLKPLRRDS